MQEVEKVTISFETSKDIQELNNSLKSKYLYELLKKVPEGGSLGLDNILPIDKDNPNEIKVTLTNKISNRKRKKDDTTYKFEVKGEEIGRGGNGIVENCLAAIMLDDENKRVIIKERAKFFAKFLICKNQDALRDINGTQVNLLKDIFIEWAFTDAIYKNVKPLQGNGENTLSMYMPRFPGNTLSEFIWEDGTPVHHTINQKYDAIKATINALRIIHKKNLVHLDLKPANVIYCSLTKRAFIIDMGTTTEEKHLIPFQSCCTLEYSAPELVNPKTLAESSADVVSFAVMIAEILIPEVFKSEIENIRKNLQFNSEYFLEEFPTLCRIFALNLNKMIDKIPQNRPSSEVVEAFIYTLCLSQKIDQLDDIISKSISANPNLFHSISANSNLFELLLHLKEEFDLDLKNYNIRFCMCEEQIELYHSRYKAALNLIEAIENEAVLYENDEVKSIIKDITSQPDYTDFIKFDPIEEKYYMQITKLRSDLTGLLYSPDTSAQMRLVAQKLLKVIRSNELNEDFEMRFHNLLAVCENVMQENKQSDGIRIFSPESVDSLAIKLRINEIIKNINLNLADCDKTEEQIQEPPIILVS
jgi:serine/threonine protein kinase